MAAYRRVDDLHLRADCLYTGISSGPNARYRVWESLYLFQKRTFTDKWHRFLLQAGCPLCRPTNSVKALQETKALTQTRWSHPLALFFIIYIARILKQVVPLPSHWLSDACILILTHDKTDKTPVSRPLFQDKLGKPASPLNFLQAIYSSWCPTNSVKALKAQ